MAKYDLLSFYVASTIFSLSFASLLGDYYQTSYQERSSYPSTSNAMYYNNAGYADYDYGRSDRQPVRANMAENNTNGDWDYHNKWHYHRNAYLSGQTEAEYYQKNHQDQPKIGFDVDSYDVQHSRSARRRDYQ